MLSSNDSRDSHVGVIASLLDTTFTSFVTLRMARLIYIMVALILFGGYLVSLLFLLFTNNMVGFVLALLVAWIVPLVWLCSIRMGMEFVIALIRSAENTSVMLDIMKAEQKNKKSE